MTTASRVLESASAEIGYREGPRNNETKYGKWYGLDFNPWCDMFVSWVFSRAGLPFPAHGGKGHAYCPEHVNWFKAQKRWFTEPKVGDVVFYNFGSGVAKHVGIVEKVLANGVQAIEGNTNEAGSANGDRVMRRVRPAFQILGYGRPAYSLDFVQQKQKETDVNKYVATANRSGGMIGLLPDGGIECWGAVNFFGGPNNLDPKDKQSIIKHGVSGIAFVDLNDAWAGYIVYAANGDTYKFDAAEADKLRKAGRL